MLSRCVLLTIFLFFVATNVLADLIRVPEEPLDIAVRETLFSAYQEDWFDAISRFDINLDAGDDPFSKPYNQRYTTLIDFELAYRMYLRDGQNVLRVIKNDGVDRTRNESLFRLAKLYYQKGQLDNALQTINRISGEIIPEIADDLAFLKAQVLITNGRYVDAITILDDLSKGNRLPGFANYNLGIAYLLNENSIEGRQQLDFAGQIAGDDEMTQSIRESCAW